MNVRVRLRQGASVALLVSAGLVFIPPLFADKLEADAANTLLPTDQRLTAQCGADSRVELSRWFYTYQFSGESAQARFRGRVVSPSCDRRFTVGLRRQANGWKVSDLSL